MTTRKVTELRPHADQGRIYGDGHDMDLVESVKKLGVLDPLVITRDNVIISGFRRWSAAKVTKLDTVPVTVFQSDNPLDIREALVHANKYRKKTRYQIACEAQVLLEVEQARARERKREAASRAGQASGASRRGESNVTRPGGEGSEEIGEAVDKVGQAFEPTLSGDTVHRATKVAETIQKLEEEGNQNAAEKLKETMNKQGYKPAYEEVQKNLQTDDSTVQTHVLDFTPADKTLKRLQSMLRDLAGKPGGTEAVQKWCEEHGVKYQLTVDELS